MSKYLVRTTEAARSNGVMYPVYEADSYDILTNGTLKLMRTVLGTRDSIGRELVIHELVIAFAPGTWITVSRSADPADQAQEITPEA